MAEENKPNGGNPEEPTGGPGNNNAKTFTQEEVNQMISDRLKREREKGPSPEKMKAFEEWEKAQQSEAEKAAAREKELADLTAKYETATRENAVIRAGVSQEDADYVMFKVGRMEGDFSANLEKFLKDNPKFTEEPTRQVTGRKHEPSSKEDQDGVEARFYARNPDLKRN